jgi:hypothetical protein
VIFKRMVSIATTVVLLVCLLAGAQPFLAHAETKVITADASYIMGDGETPDFAEARALQKAKQTALEEAGTYVQSYTKVQNLDLTAEEIQTLAGGVLQVEVLEKTRSLVSDGLRFYTKIKATVTTEKMEELAHRIKGKNVAEEYTKLQTEYARLSRELEAWKQHAAKTTQGPERNATLDQIREGEKAFARVLQREGEFFQRLVSGKQLLESARSDKGIIDGLLKTIVETGYIVKVGDVEAVAALDAENVFTVKVPLTIRLSETIQEAVSHAASVLGGTVRTDVDVNMKGNYGDVGARNIKATLVRIGKHPETAVYFQDGIMKLALLVTFLNSSNVSFDCLLWNRAGRMKGGHWFQMRRIFPIMSFNHNSRTQITEIDNGEYDTITPLIVKTLNTGYVGIVRDEATFIAMDRLPAWLMRNLTGVSVRVLSITAEDERRLANSRCDIEQ